MTINNSDLQDQLNLIFSKFKNKPIIFSGSGTSKRYLNLPDWENLLNVFAKLCKPSARFPLDTYVNDASEYIRNNDSLDEKCTLSVVGELIETDYNKLFFENSNFEEDIQLLYESLNNRTISPFKIAVSSYLTTSATFTDTYYNEIDSLLRTNNKVSNFITTNYDSFLENTFTSYVPVVGQEDLFNKTANSIGNIFKIHGSITSPDSLILTQSDYYKFQQRQKFLSAKLLTFFLEYPIIFIGYSMSDTNIEAIITDIKTCLNEENAYNLSKQLIFIEFVDDDSSQEVINIEIAKLQMTKIKLKDYNLLYKAFDSIIDTIDVNTLRKVESQITQLVSSADTSVERVYATSLENRELDDTNLAIYIGHDTSVFDLGYSAIRLINICEDVLFNKKSYDPIGVLEKTIPSQKSFYVRSKIPLHKYINQLDSYEIDQFYIKNSCIIYELSDLYNNGDKNTMLYKQPISDINLIIETDDSLQKKLRNIYLCLKALDHEEVKAYIKDIWILKDSIVPSTYLTKIICAIDFWENKKEH